MEKLTMMKMTTYHTRTFYSIAVLVIAVAKYHPDGCHAFTTTSSSPPYLPLSHYQASSSSILFAASSNSSTSPSIGIFYGTSTGSTEEAARLISETFGEVASAPIDIDEIKGSVAAKFALYDSLVVGTPTWNTGSDTERSGTGWDEIYYSEMTNLNIAGKKVAVFGLGDSVSYSENYADATGELHDVFESLGCKMIGYTSQEGYQHKTSKSIRGDLFCGLLLDAVNEEELTEERVTNWVAKLLEEGILESNRKATPNNNNTIEDTASVLPSSPQIGLSATVAFDDQVLAEEILTEVRKTRSGYMAHYNARTDKTMWISTDGRSSYVTPGVPGYE